jgi:enamine deaminase RidA (YjgF/YER057c/UK114 family)
MEILLPEGWPRPSGYSNGISAQGRTIFVAGQIGWDKDGKIVSDLIVDQVRQALMNTVEVLRAGNAAPEHIARMTWYFTDKSEYLSALKGIGDAYRSVIGNHYPAMSLLFVEGLLEPGAKVEIESTAVV